MEILILPTVLVYCNNSAQKRTQGNGGELLNFMFLASISNCVGLRKRGEDRKNAN